MASLPLSFGDNAISTCREAPCGAVAVAVLVVLVALAGAAWLATPTFLPAFILGIVTVGAGWFLLAPGMGAGWAASKRPNPMKIRALNLVSHTVFTLGLYGTALLIR